MRTTHSSAVRWAWRSGLSVVVATALGYSALAQTNGEKKGTVERIKVHGKSLDGNLEGDSADRDVFVYLPPG